MDFSARLIQLRHERSLTQQALAYAVNIHVNQIRRYEAGTAQPTLDALVSLAKGLQSALIHWSLMIIPVTRMRTFGYALKR